MIGNADLLIKAQTQDAPPSRRSGVSADANGAEGEAGIAGRADQDAAADGAKATPKADFAAVLLAEETAVAASPTEPILTLPSGEETPPPAKLAMEVDVLAFSADQPIMEPPDVSPAPPKAVAAPDEVNASAASPKSPDGPSQKPVEVVVAAERSPATPNDVGVAPPLVAGGEEDASANAAKANTEDAPTTVAAPLLSERVAPDGGPRGGAERAVAAPPTNEARLVAAPPAQAPAAASDRIKVTIDPAEAPVKAKPAQVTETSPQVAPPRVASPPLAASTQALQATQAFQAAPAARLSVARGGGAAGPAAEASPIAEKATFEASLFALKGEGTGGAVSREAALASAPAAAPARPAVVTSQISAQLAAALAGGDADRVEIQLDPPELGRLSITYAIGDDRLAAVLSAERGDTSELLRRHADMLSKELERLGFGEVSLSFADRGGNQREADDRLSGAAMEAAETTRDAPASVGPSTALGADGRLDIRL